MLESILKFDSLIGKSVSDAFWKALLLLTWTWASEKMYIPYRYIKRYDRTDYPVGN